MMNNNEKTFNVLRVINNCIMMFYVVFVIKLFYTPISVGLMLSCLWVVPFCIALDIIHEKAVRFAGFTMMQVALVICMLAVLGALGFFLPDMIVVALGIFLSYYAMINGIRIINPSIFIMIFYGLIFLLGLFASNMTIQKCAIAGQAISTFLCLIYYNAREVSRSLVQFQNKDAVPFDTIRRINILMLTPCTLIMGLSVLGIIIYDKNMGIIDWIKAQIIAFLRFIFSLLPRSEESGYEPELSQGGAAMPEGMLDQGEDNPVMTAIWNALMYTAGVAVAIFLLWLIYKGVMEFIRVFNINSRSKRGEKREFIRPKELKRKSGAYNASKKSFTEKIFERFTPSMRMRRLYIKYINSQPMSSDIRKSQTPEELELTAMGHAGDSRIRTLYERARYDTTAAATTTDYNEMKELMK